MAAVKGFVEGILLSLAFIAILNVAISSLNIDYGKNYDSGFRDESNTEQLFIDYQDSSQLQLIGGEAEFDAQQGITVKSSWGITKDMGNIIWNFFTGGWIEQVVESWHLGESGTIIAKFFRIMYFIAVVFAFLFILFKVIY